jgi:hypothetical protein
MDCLGEDLLSGPGLSSYQDWQVAQRADPHNPTEDGNHSFTFSYDSQMVHGSLDLLLFRPSDDFRAEQLCEQTAKICRESRICGIEQSQGAC